MIDSDAEGQWSPPTIRRCACFAKVDPETNKTEWFCTEDSDPRCKRNLTNLLWVYKQYYDFLVLIIIIIQTNNTGRRLPIGKFTMMKDKVLNQGMLGAVHEESALSVHWFVLCSAYL